MRGGVAGRDTPPPPHSGHFLLRQHADDHRRQRANRGRAVYVAADGAADETDNGQEFQTAPEGQSTLPIVPYVDRVCPGKPGSRHAPG